MRDWMRGGKESVLVHIYGMLSRGVILRFEG